MNLNLLVFYQIYQSTVAVHKLLPCDPNEYFVGRCSFSKYGIGLSEFVDDWIRRDLLFLEAIYEHQRSS